MYFIELIIKKILNRKHSNEVQLPDFEPVGENISDVEDFENCEHVFMPIDSTGETLGSSKCGFLIKKEDLPKFLHNPFANGGL